VSKSKPKTAKEPEARTETYMATLWVELTTEQVADRADRAASIVAERDGKEEEQKAAAKGVVTQRL
jgi:hypothetical protein